MIFSVKFHVKDLFLSESGELFGAFNTVEKEKSLSGCVTYIMVYPAAQNIHHVLHGF